MKTVVITGVSRGIGKALAECFLQNGDLVIGTSTQGDSPFAHEHITVLSLDLSEPRSIRKCGEAISRLCRQVDVLINNGAILFDHSGPAFDIQALRQTLEVNLIGTVDFTEKIIPVMKPGGHIVNISSKAGSLSSEKEWRYPEYKISKAALNMVTRTLATRLKGTITVSSVSPGWVKTDMGGPNADMEPKEAAEHIFKLANSNVETGQFWFKGERLPW